MKKLVLALLICLGLIGGAVAYRYETAMVTVPVKCEWHCNYPAHKGNSLLDTELKSVVMSHWDALSPAVRREFETCPECRAAKERWAVEEQARAARERRVAEAKAEAERLMQELEVQFGVKEPGSTPDWGQIPTESKILPGYRLKFVFLFKNNSQQAIPEGAVRAIVRPADKLIFGPYGASIYREDITQEAAECRRLLQKMTGSGFSVPKIPPYNSPYYAGENTIYSLEIGHLHDFDEAIPFGNWLAVHPKTKPGQTIEFRGYVSFKGHEIPVGTASVNVIYRQ